MNGISPFEMGGLAFMAALIWFWLDSLKARDAGVEAVRAACTGEGLQLLDDTVVATALKPVRNEDGRLSVRRVYSFEYSDTGNNRRRGSVELLGHRVVLVHIGLREVPAQRLLH